MAPATLRKQWGVDELTPGRRQHLLSDGVFDVFVKGLKGFFFVNVTLNPPVCTENSGSGIPWLRQTEIIWLVPKLHFSSNALGGRGGDRAGSKAGGVPLPPKKSLPPPLPPSSGREAIPPARVPEGAPPHPFPDERSRRRTRWAVCPDLANHPHPPPGLSLGWGPPATFFLPGIPPPAQVKNGRGPSTPPLESTSHTPTQGYLGGTPPRFPDATSRRRRASIRFPLGSFVGGAPAQPGKRDLPPTFPQWEGGATSRDTRGGYAGCLAPDCCCGILLPKAHLDPVHPPG